nr:13143_t:CDS:2 [Entrophospora candida]
MWSEIDVKLQDIQIKELGYNHPTCSNILDDTTLPISDIPEESRQIFNEPSKNFLIPVDETLISRCKQFVCKERECVKTVKKLSNARFGKFLDELELLQNMTDRMLAVYVCELLSPLLNIVMDDLPIGADTWGRKASSASAERKCSFKRARRPDFSVIVKIKNETVEIGYLETGRPDSTAEKQLRDHKNSTVFRRILSMLFLKGNKCSIFTINVAGTVLGIQCMGKEPGTGIYND